MSALVSAIDAAVAYVREHLEPWTEDDVDQFRALATEVYRHAAAANLLHALPQRDDLLPYLEPRDVAMRPVEFEAKLNLPGDWQVVGDERHREVLAEPLRHSYPLDFDFGSFRHQFVPAVPERWFVDMVDLRRMALQAPAPAVEAMPQSKGEQPSLDARALAVFIQHRDWTKKRIAKHLHCNEKSLAPARCPKLAAAIAANKATRDPGRNLRRGSKGADGSLEAWDE